MAAEPRDTPAPPIQRPEEDKEAENAERASLVGRK